MRVVAHVALLVGAVLLQGCAFGAGSTYVGQWRRHERVSFRACEEAEDGSCSKEVDVTTTVPARRFGGVSLGVGAMGMATTWSGDDVDAAFRLVVSGEALVGRGRFAFGLRTDFVLDIGTASHVPVHAVGHVGISERFSAYGAFGWSPRTNFTNDNLGLEDVTTRSVIRGLLGLQTVLVRSGDDTRLYLDVELDWMHALRQVDYDSLGVTLHLGLAI